MKIKLLNEKAIIPTRGSEESAGLDLYATDELVMIEPYRTEKIHTGVAMEIPNGYFGGIYARSGLATKYGIRPSNCTGVIDSDFRNEIIVALYNDSPVRKMIKEGDRVAQIIIQPYEDVSLEVVDELSETSRTGGFGSTGR